MPTVVDSLVVSLGLDTKDFKRGQREVGDAWEKARGTQLKNAKLMESSNKALLDGFNKLKLEALGFLTALAGAREIKEFVSNVTTANAAVGRLSANIGEQPQMLQAWGNAVERMGGRADDASQSLTKVAKAFYDLKYNGKALPEEVYRVFAMAGRPVPSTADSLDSFLNKTAGALAEIAKHDRTAAFFFGEGMGLSDSVINLMLRYGDATSKYLKSLEGLGATDKQIKNSEILQEKWSKLSQTVVQIGRDILDWFSPVFMGALEKVQGVFDAIHRATSYSGPQDLTPHQRGLRHALGLDRWDKQDGKEPGGPNAGGNPAKFGRVPDNVGAGGAQPRGGGRAGLARRLGQYSGASAPGSPADIGAATLPGFTPEETQAYLNRLGQYESRNRYIGNNSLGYGGRWQMGDAEVAGTGNRRDADWYANKGGVQDKSMMAYTLQHYNELVRRGVITPGMSKEQIAGYLGAAHIGGIGGAAELARGRVRRDPNRTGTDTYFNLMRGIGAGAAAGGSSDTVVFGDSIGKGVKDAAGAGGVAEERMGSTWVTSQIQNYKDSLKGKKIVLSSGISNSHDPGAVRNQMDALIAKGVDPKDITILGVGDRGDFNGYNDQLSYYAMKYGAKFKGITPGGDHVHPSNYKKLWEGIQGQQSGVPGPQSSLSSLHSTHPVTTSQTSNAMHIGAIHVNAPQATDADGIAGNIHESLLRYQTSMSAQSGQV